MPAALRAIRRFTPGKRARLGAASLGAALESEVDFRAAVVLRLREALPAVVAAAESGEDAPAVPPADLAAVAYLLDVENWQELAAAARPAPAERPLGADESAQRLRTQLHEARSEAREEVGRLRAELASARKDADDLRRRLTRAEAAVRRAEQAQEAAEREAAAVQQACAATERDQSAQIRRLRGRLQDAESSAAAARRGSRSERDAQSARLRVLLEALTSAAAGLRRELDLPTGVVRPTDLAADNGTGEQAPAIASGLLPALRRGRATDDPAVLDELLAVPGVHLIIDGYNVTKLGYPTLTLEDQRARLLNGLAGLVARATGAEVTCVFDGTSATSRPVAVGTPRGLRVLFSAPGELADELIVRLVAAEPMGRAVVVVSNDREVAARVRRAGGESLPSESLLGRLARS